MNKEGFPWRGLLFVHAIKGACSRKARVSTYMPHIGLFQGDSLGQRCGTVLCMNLQV